MSSVIDYEKCPRCGGIVSTEFDCRTSEIWKQCGTCGKTEGWHYERDENYDVILDENGSPKKTIDDFGGYGVASLNFGAVGVTYAFESNSDNELREAFYEEIEKNDKIVKEKCYLTVWDDEKKIVVAEFGTLPETYDELEARTKAETD